MLSTSLVDGHLTLLLQLMSWPSSTAYAMCKCIRFCSVHFWLTWGWFFFQPSEKRGVSKCGSSVSGTKENSVLFFDLCILLLYL
ncbi:unnamed protein product [Cylicocyclus nassatus]|uniref:Secreted protein n=1 Tax=Cylicocyclus nassatus TaxID=53992 RepID=A0AA36MEP7_CYLNA|nr:unnamed protein product [Cylicocyclus nassatus]